MIWQCAQPARIQWTRGWVAGTKDDAGAPLERIVMVPPGRVFYYFEVDGTRIHARNQHTIEGKIAAAMMQNPIVKSTCASIIIVMNCVDIEQGEERGTWLTMFW